MNERWTALRNSRAFSDMVCRLYGSDADVLALQQERYGKLVSRFIRRFEPKEKEFFFFSAPGRTEIGGNHTDHNHGRVLAAAVHLDTIACVQKTDDGVIIVDSEGFPPMRVELSSLAVQPREAGMTMALIRGTAALMKEMGYAVGGFRATISSSVLRGSGLSSSAAFEVLLAAILDGLYNYFNMDSQKRAVLAQNVENTYFGKPCGLMDQMACSVGGLVAIDFAEKDAKVRSLLYDFEAKGYALCVVNTGGSHGDLTEDYAAIRREMEAVAGVFGAAVLRDVPEEQFYEGIPEALKSVGERALLRAMHFYDDNARVVRQADALERDDLPAFFREVTESGDSSWKLLQNVYARPGEEQMALGIELSRRFLAGEGAQRVHGGGFAGTIQAYVPIGRLDAYRAEMERVFGKGSVTALRIRPVGPVMLCSKGNA